MASHLNVLYFVFETKRPIQIFYVEFLIDQFEASKELKSKRSYLLWANKMSIVQANNIKVNNLWFQIVNDKAFAVIVSM